VYDVRETSAVTLGHSWSIDREWIGDGDRLKTLTVLKVFAVEDVAIRFDRCGYEQRIVPGEMEFRSSERIAEKQGEECTASKGRNMAARYWSTSAGRNTRPATPFSVNGFTN
jgi:hypothetical protein